MQKIYRLANNASFNYVYRKGTSYGGKFAVIVFVKASTLKVGISVSKKVGGSVVRSLVKRRISESFRQIIPNINATYNYVIVAKSAAAHAAYCEIDAELKHLLQKAGHIAGGAD